MRKTIPIEKILPNPWRDFSLYPYDEEQIERLRASIQDTGFWLGVQVRKSPTKADFYELAFGHHRLEAAKREAEASNIVPLANADVVEMDDDLMLKIMTTENASQRVNNAAAGLDSVAAITRRLGYLLLKFDEASFGRILPKLGDYARLRGRLLNGSGLGHGAIIAYAPAGSLERTAVQTWLGVLKDSGRLAEIITDVRRQIEIEEEADRKAAEQAAHEEIERERKAAEKRAAAEAAAAKRAEEARKAAERADKARIAADKAATEAKEAAEKARAEQAAKAAREAAERERLAQIETQRQLEVERKRREADEKRAKADAERRSKEQAEVSKAIAKAKADAESAAKKAAEKAAAGTPFDSRVANLFRNDHQLNVFRLAVTDDLHRQYIRQEDQYQLAKDILAYAKARGRELTGNTIQKYILELVAAQRGAQGKDERWLKTTADLVAKARGSIDRARHMWAAAFADLIGLLEQGAPVPADLPGWLDELEEVFGLNVEQVRKAAGLTRHVRTIEGKAKNYG